MEKNITEKYIEAVGRRKTSTARVRITPSAKASFIVNGKDAKEYFQTEEERRLVDIEKLLKRSFPRERAVVSPSSRASSSHRPAKPAPQAYVKKAAPVDDWFLKPYEPSPSAAKIAEQPSLGPDKPKKQIAALLCRPPAKN